jgi:Low affinity iron permease
MRVSPLPAARTGYTEQVKNAAWVPFSLAFRFPGRLESIFQALVAALTLAMVFIIQHTQSRQEAATQRKLDEILRVPPDADS